MSIRKKIVVVDDTPDLLSNIVDVLIMEGFDVTGFRTAADALAQIRFDEPDVIITDLHMPHMDGLEFISELRKSQTLAPVVIFSAKPRAEYHHQAEALGVTTFITKPASIELLVETIKPILASTDQ